MCPHRENRYSRKTCVHGKTGNAEICIVAIPDDDTKPLTSNRVIDGAPGWNPDVCSILCLSEGDGSTGINATNKNGEQKMDGARYRRHS